jgi:hypothetical protein
VHQTRYTRYHDGLEPSTLYSRCIGLTGRACLGVSALLRCLTVRHMHAFPNGGHHGAFCFRDPPISSKETIMEQQDIEARDRCIAAESWLVA